MNAPQALVRWHDRGTSRIPFWAYTDPDLYQRELERLFYGPALVLRGPGHRDSQHRRLQTQLGR